MKRMMSCAAVVLGLVVLNSAAEKARWDDQNEDGQVTKQEFMDARIAVAQKQGKKFAKAYNENKFAEQDANHDGVLTGEELVLPAK